MATYTLQRWAPICLLAIALFIAKTAGAQSLNFMDQKSDAPVEIEADQGIEW